MTNTERRFYLVVILLLASGMSYEFHRFSAHYKSLETQLDQVMEYCE